MQKMINFYSSVLICYICRSKGRKCLLRKMSFVLSKFVQLLCHENSKTDSGKWNRTVLCCVCILLLNDQCCFFIDNRNFCLCNCFHAVKSQFGFPDMVGSCITVTGSHFTNYIFSKIKFRRLCHAICIGGNKRYLRSLFQFDRSAVCLHGKNCPHWICDIFCRINCKGKPFSQCQFCF